MKHCVQKLILFTILFISSIGLAIAGEPIKINELIFDNSDSLIYVQSKGVIDETVTFTKGYLKEPDRIYLDINNAILTTPKKTYIGKYSVFNNIKISQFTIEPKTVRIVFEYNKNLNLEDFSIYKSKDSIFIKTKKNLIDNSKMKTVYSNSKLSERTTFYKGSQFEENVLIQASELIQIDNIPKNEILEDLTPTPKAPKTASKYYIDSITKTKNGIIINGIGKLNLIPAFTLTEPDRLIIDLDDTVVNPELRNKTFIIGEIDTEKKEAPILVGVDPRETIKIGQNSQSIARLVIQGVNSKDYRGIISPDSKSLFLTNKSNIITSKMSENNANILASKYSYLKGIETIGFLFDDSVAFNVFEENSNLYLDINNINAYNNEILEPVKKYLPDMQTIRIAMDKLRIIIPNVDNKNISVKTSPDNEEIRIYTKSKEQRKRSITPIIIGRKRAPEISNLFKVVIDAGHGGSDVGATRNNVFEKDINLKVSKMVEKELKKKNVKVYMVRDKDKTVSLAERCEYSNDKKPDIFVSIHANASLNDETYGIETHWWKNDSIKLAEQVHKQMKKNIKKWDTIDRGLFKSQFYVINHTDAPAILCEIGFISNRKERNELIKTNRQEEIAEAIADGIYNYLKARR